MARREENLSDVLLKSPWWVSVIVALVVFVGLRWVAPAFFGDNQMGRAIGQGIAQLAPFPAALCLMFAVGSAVFALKKRTLVDGQTSLETLRSVSWKHFEWLVGEAYRRKGYEVEESLGGGADGGIDLVLRKGDATTLVQCKQWKVFSVGAPVVREMFGLLTHHQASRAIIITSGRFTREAEAFAQGKPIELIDGPQLLALVQGVQIGNIQPVTSVSSTRPLALVCPECGGAMVVRTAKRGANAGNSFLGCATYPACKGTREIAA